MDVTINVTVRISSHPYAGGELLLPQLTVDPTAARVLHGDTVSWTAAVFGADGKAVPGPTSILVVFSDGRPLGEEVKIDDGRTVPVGRVEIRSKDGATGKKRVIALSGLFHYRVIVSTPGQIFADVGCPSITVGK